MAHVLQPDAHIQIRLFGTPEVIVDQVAVPIERRKALALLAYLAIEPGAHPRERLATLLAPDDDPASARAGLRRALAVLSPLLRPWLISTNDTLELRRDAQVFVDRDQFLAMTQSLLHPDTSGIPYSADQVELLEQAVSLVRGDLLDGFQLPGSPDFEAWQFGHAEQLRQVLVSVLERLSHPDTVIEPSRAIGYAQRWVALDPLYEPAQRRLMQRFALHGQANAAIRQYRALVELLERELGVAPEEATTALYDQIRSSERSSPSSSRWSSTPPRISAAPIVPPIDTPALPFVGREAETAQIHTSLGDPGCRLLTLVGPGGMGKTRLALHAAQQIASSFADGVHSISLVGITTPDRLLSTIALGLGLAVQSDPLDLLVTLLRERRALLVLDNADQVIEGAPLLGALLQRTQFLKLLVTSRERLRLQEEWVLDLSGLSVPSEHSVEAARESSAVQLFLQRAHQVRPDVGHTPEDLLAIAEICQLVEGMPLALELAAAWVRVLTPVEIAQELAQNMALLTTTLQNVPERHRSVEGVFAQAWERLSADERTGLQRLSVFENGFTRAAAVDVAGASPMVLAGLADKALIRRDRAGRYALHELLRQFAARKLADHPEQRQATIQRYCRHYLRLLEQRTRDLVGGHQRQALTELEVEFDNLWQAWSWAIEDGLLGELANALDGMYRLCEMRGWYSDGMLALDLLLQHFGTPLPIESPEAILVARTNARQAALRCWIGQFEQAQHQLDEAMQVIRLHASALDLAFGHMVQGTVAYDRGDDATAQRQFEAGLAAYQALGYESGVAWALDMLGDLAGSLGQYDQARDRLTQSITIASALGDQISVAWSLSSLGRVLRLIGNPAEAQQLLEESREIFVQLDDQHGLASVYVSLGELAYSQADQSQARSYWLMALRSAREVLVVPLILDTFVLLATVLLDLGQAEQAHLLAAHVSTHPASWKESIAAARQMLETSGQLLSRQAAEQAARRGRSSAWETLVSELLG
ncbi:MAG: BTAD domain-containing putative transcriptional regulator [Roseiflexaceae bacterium]